jgi:hypothetical protein
LREQIASLNAAVARLRGAPANDDT